MWKRFLRQPPWLPLILSALLLAGLPAQVVAAHATKEAKEPAILLVTFGTSVDSAKASFANIEKQVRAAFPKAEVRWAYTSKIIRKKLEKEGTHIDSPEVALARLMDDGYTKVVVQSLHMIPGAEFHELDRNVPLFGQMAGGFSKVVMAMPLLIDDATMEKTLQEVRTKVVPKERKPDEAVVLMGHGTHHFADAIYSALAYKAQKMDPNLFVGTVEGFPSFDEVKAMLVAKKMKKAYLIPFMTVAGDHAMNDMAGDEPDSWKSQLTKVGIACVPVLHGLGEYDSIAELWVAHLKAAMATL